MRINAADPRFRIGKSTIAGAGKGLFAKRPVAKGEKLHVFGIVVKRGSVADLCTRYADAYKFRVGKQLLIPLGHAGMINHASSPNVSKVIVRGQLYIKTLRALRAGDELFFCYSRYAQKRFRLS